MTDTTDDFTNIANQYRAIKATKCECGGRFKTQRVALKEEEDGLYDLHDTICIECGRPRQFKFKTIFTKKKSTTEHTEKNLSNTDKLM